MGRASSKKVSRAASTGGGRTARGARPLAWYAAMGLVVLLGVAGIVFSRAERRQDFAAGADLTPPVAGRDHWHAAVGFFLCDSFAPNITDERDPKGIHTHGDGVIHIHPTLRSAAGSNATLGVFADAVRMTLTDGEIKLPGGKSFKEGETKCDGKPGIVQVKAGDKVVTENLRNLKYSDRQLLTVAFAPKGAELPSPPSAGQLNNLEDVPSPGSIPPLPDGAGVPGAGAPGGAPTDAPPEGQPAPAAPTDASPVPSQP